ncbi:AAA family ATPase [Flavobacterium sp. UBA4854]|uniref:AAA family ATPase n=1 Tax=Flavobacterium sp. UBA4854 TaxID=1946548 RepID=UPI00257F57CE|nr:AAA family ATPase [Flavobacterium sp. UBA4854]
MKINSLAFFNKSSHLGLENITFDKLTLLVGASGVGKTHILKAIIELKNIAFGDFVNGIKWDINFDTISGDNYNWSGEYEDNGVRFVFSNDEDDDNIRKNKPKIINETLVRNSIKIIERNSTGTFFNENKMPKFSSEESVLSILKEEDLIKPALESFQRIILSDQSDSQREPFKLKLFSIEKFSKQFTSLEKIQESDLDIRTKLYLTQEHDIKTFEKIKERFCEVFPQVQNIKIAPLDDIEGDLPGYIKEYPFIQIQELGVDKWIEQGRISSGMFRTLIHISELYLCAEGTVFLIDEFENSLGINCIDELTNDILQSNRKVQFIITSHHPYIINNIHYSKWKLVTRKSGSIRVHNVDEFNIGNSKHDAFMQLMQLEEYQTGSEQ